MTTMILALAAGISVTGLAIALQIFRLQTRRQRLKGLELRPNCLLTRYPIVFLGGQRSLFRFLNYWNEVPTYLREHGYEVLVIDIPKDPLNGKALVKGLQTLPGKCHLIADSSQQGTLIEIAKTNLPQIASITLVKNKYRRDKVSSRHGRKAPPSVDDLKPLSSAIETFEVTPPGLNTAMPLLSSNNLERTLSRLLLWAHNFYHWEGTPVDPIETAEVSTNQKWVLEEKFLDLAILLAERDTQWSDSP